MSGVKSQKAVDLLMAYLLSRHALKLHPFCPGNSVSERAGTNDGNRIVSKWRTHDGWFSEVRKRCLLRVTLKPATE